MINRLLGFLRKDIVKYKSFLIVPYLYTQKGSHCVLYNINESKNLLIVLNQGNLRMIISIAITRSKKNL